MSVEAVDDLRDRSLSLGLDATIEIPEFAMHSYGPVGHFSARLVLGDRQVPLDRAVVE